MPLFEYLCADCARQFTFLTGVIAANSEPRCPRCDSTDLRKLMSRVARGRSDDARMDALAERLESQDLDDAATVRAFAREMGREMGGETGEDLSDELEDMIEGEARGESDGPAGDSFSGDDGKIY